MFNQLVQNWKRANDARDRIRQEMEQKRVARLREEWQELLTQSIINVRHIRSSINTLRTNVNNLKGEGPRETRRKRESAKQQLKWFEGKLLEETGMVEYYCKLLGKKVEI
jgi:hypothetical protein